MAQTANPPLADRLNLINESATLKMARLSRELKEQGKDIITLSLGEPDFDTPDHIKNAGIEAIRNGYTSYPPVPGYPELRQAITQKYSKDYGLSYDPGQVVVSTGAKQALINTFLALLNKGDEVIVPTPYWVSYPEMISFAEGKMVNIHTDVASDYKITPEQLDAAITPQTKAFLLCSPSNPTGAIYSKQELEGLAKVLEKHPHVQIISDEIYDYVNFGAGQYSLAEFDNLRDRVIVINGVSKSYAMTGWRIGYMIASPTIVQACTKIQGQFTSGASSISQMAALEAISGTLAPTYQMRDAFRERRDLVIEKLKDIPNIQYNIPEGAFYLFANVKGWFGKSDGKTEIKGSEDFCTYLLEKAEVALVPGIAFGDDECVRISFAASSENLAKALDRIHSALNQLQNA